MLFLRLVPTTRNSPWFHFDVGFAGFEQVRGDLLPLATILSTAFTIADPPTDSERDPYVPMPNGILSVSPWTISTLS